MIPLKTLREFSVVVLSHRNSFFWCPSFLVDPRPYFCHYLSSLLGGGSKFCRMLCPRPGYRSWQSTTKVATLGYRGHFFIYGGLVISKPTPAMGQKLAREYWKGHPRTLSLLGAVTVDSACILFSKITRLESDSRTKVDTMSEPGKLQTSCHLLHQCRWLPNRRHLPILTEHIVAVAASKKYI